MKPIYFFLILALALSGCTKGPAPETQIAQVATDTRLPSATATLSHTPTPTITLTPTSRPTDTPTQTASLTPTLTKTPTKKLTQTQTSSQTSTPAVELLKAYKGIPIMPGAVSGQEESGNYVFTISATIEQVKSYYSTELTKMGKMCILNAFEASPTSDGLMCIADGPMIIVMIDMLEDNRLQVIIIVD